MALDNMKDNIVPLIPSGSSRYARTDLVDLTSTVEPDNIELDLVHITAAGWADEIIRGSAKLETRQCDVFGRPLLYFFIGRSTFRLRRGEIGSDQVGRFPSAFLVRPERLGTPAHIYPFDTGAAAKGKFFDAHEPGVFLQDHRLDNDLDAVRRFIKWAFGSYKDYLEGSLSGALRGSVLPNFLAANSYLKIANLAGQGANQPDDRACSIEVAYSSHVDIRTNASIIVLPEPFIEPGPSGTPETDLMKKIARMKLKVETYPWQPGLEPNTQIKDVQRIITKNLRGLKRCP
jgi:hypothetical protein